MQEMVSHEVRPSQNAAEDPGSDGVPEKDETEERLETLLFGDDDVFLQGLQARPADPQWTIRTDRENAGVEDAGDDDLESIADENVRTSHALRKMENANKSSFVALLPRFWCRYLTEQLPQYA